MPRMLKDALARCRPTFGGWIQVGHPTVAEVMARTGFDWIAIDCEHAAIDIEGVIALLRAAAPWPTCTPLVRVPHNDLLFIRRVLDAGAGGVIVPMINTAEEARRAVQAATYPPVGVRGFGFCRANQHGDDFDAYVARANDEVVVIAQVEHIDSVRNLEAILDTPGIDGVFVGPYDLSGSLGIPGRLDDPRMKQALDRVRTLCRDRHKPAGIHVVHVTPDRVKQALADGFTFVALGLDTVMLQAAGRQALDWARQAAP